MNISSPLTPYCKRATAQPPPPFDDRVSVFDRQEKVEGFRQALLSAATIIIIGVGGIGVRFARMLARMGVGKMILIEHDTVEDTNLHRQDLYHHKDVGQPKAFAALENLLPHCTAPTEIVACNQKFEDLLALSETFAGASAFVCGVDNDDAREAVCRHFHTLGVPGVYASVSLDASTGVVRVQEPEQACWRCMLPADYQNAVAPCATASSPEVLELVSGFGVFALLTLLMHRSRNWNYRLVTLPGFMSDEARVVPANPECPICRNG